MQYHAENLVYEWWDWVYEQAIEDGKALGFYIDDINFSGFWSQGDGAAWSGHIKIPEFIEAHITDEHPDYPRYFTLLQLLDEEWAEPRATVTSNSRSFNMNVYGFDYYWDRADGDEELTRGIYAGASVAELVEGIDADGLVIDLDQWMAEKARDFAKDIYKRLEEEYEHITSEEYVKEHCEANEYEFDEDGRIL
jgi:hypothetical protein